MPWMISCYDDNDEIKHHPVPHAVFVYVRQLETYIKRPEQSRLLEKYAFRFGEDR